MGEASGPTRRVLKSYRARPTGAGIIGRVATFPRGHHAAQLHARHARMLVQLAQETGLALKRQTRDATPVDTRSLRGLPAVGRGIAGAIYGTNPEHTLIARER